MPCFKSNNLYLAMPKMKLLLQKNCKIFECWGFCSLSSCVSLLVVLNDVFKCLLNLQFMYLFLLGNRKMTTLPPDLQWLPAAEGSAPILQSISLPIANFWLCTWLVVSTRNANALHQNFSSIASTKK